jgi:hypothetical protein
MLVLFSCERKPDEQPDEQPAASSSIEPEAGMNPRLDEFARQVGAKMGEIGASSGQKASELQAELSAYIAEQTQNLMSQGVSVTEIQDALQAAAGRVQQTYAPDADQFGGDTGGRLDSPLSVKKEAAYIIDELWKEFTALREVYRRAAEQGKGMFVFTGYEKY